MSLLLLFDSKDNSFDFVCFLKEILSAIIYHFLSYVIYDDAYFTSIKRLSSAMYFDIISLACFRLLTKSSYAGYSF